MLYDTTQLALERAMQGATLRNTVLAGNLANANTPGYVRKDVDFQSTLANAIGDGDLASASFTVTQDEGATRADGGGVDVDRESAELAANGLEYQALVQVARARLDVLEAAMGAK